MILKSKTVPIRKKTLCSACHIKDYTKILTKFSSRDFFEISLIFLMIKYKKKSRLKIKFNKNSVTRT